VHHGQDTTHATRATVAPLAVTYISSAMATAKYAPCWICLEEDSDEGGGRLVRACACRGDAAGYHASCIIKYAAQKSKELLQKAEGGTEIRMCSFSQPWEHCPNCRQPYTDKDLERRLAEAFVESTEDFPDSHYVRFLSRFNRASLLKDQDDLGGALDEFSYLLDVVKSNDAGLSLNGKRMYDHDAQDYLMFTFEFRINNNLGSIYEEMNEFPKALEYFNACMSQVDDSSTSRVSLGQRGHTEDCIRRVKFKMETVDDGSAELAWKVEAARRHLERETRLTRLTVEDKVDTCNERRIFDCKMELAIHLMNDSQFLESLKLFKEGADHFQRVLGPEHQCTITAKTLLARTKAMYLQQLKET